MALGQLSTRKPGIRTRIKLELIHILMTEDSQSLIFLGIKDAV